MKGNAGFEMQVRDREIDKLREQISKLTDALSKAREDTDALWRERDELKAERDTLRLYHNCTAEKESERERVISRQAEEIEELKVSIPEDVQSFIYLVTLHLQASREKTSAQMDSMFHRAYHLYVKYDVEDRKRDALKQEEVKDAV